MEETKVETPWFAVLAAVFVAAMLFTPRIEIAVAFAFMLVLARPHAPSDTSVNYQVHF